MIFLLCHNRAVFPVSGIPEQLRFLDIEPNLFLERIERVKHQLPAHALAKQDGKRLTVDIRMKIDQVRLGVHAILDGVDV